MLLTKYNIVHIDILLLLTVCLYYVYFLGSAASTKAIFLYIDELANKTMASFFEENMPLGGNQVSHYADLFSLALAISFSG